MPKGCSYCNGPSGNTSYELKKRYIGSSSDSKLSISVPVCEKCLKEIRTRVVISRVLGNLLFLLVTGLFVFIINLTNNFSFFIVYCVYFLLHVYLYNIIFTDSQRPAKFDLKRKLRFRNKDYQKKFWNINQEYYNTKQIA